MGVKDIYISHKPEILTGLGLSGLVVSNIFTAIGTYNFIRETDKKKEELGVEQLPIPEYIKSGIKYYSPSVGVVTGSGACFLGGLFDSFKRLDTMATALGLSEATLKLTEAKMTDILGEKKAQEIKDEVNIEKAHQARIKDDDILDTPYSAGPGAVLCFDPISQRPFKCTIERIHEVEKLLTKDLYCSMWVSLNDYYDLIGLSRSTLGDDLGWNTDTGIEFCYSYGAVGAEDSRPCLVISFRVEPRFDYRNLH